MNRTIAVVVAFVAVVFVGCGGDPDPDFLEGDPEGAPPVALYFEGVADPDQRTWNRAANDWIVSAPDSTAFYFRVEIDPRPEGACGLLVRRGEGNRFRPGPCLSVVEYKGEPGCFMKATLAAMLGVAPDAASCEVTDADRAAVLQKWGKPWAVTVLPAGN